MEAPAGRRQTIIAGQKYPPAFQVTYYREAPSAVISYLSSDEPDESMLANEAAALRLRAAAASGWEQQRLHSNAEAIGIFRHSLAQSLATLGTFSPLRQKLAKPIYAGVEVSVQPDLLITATRRGKDIRGAVKLRFGKDRHLGSEAGRYGAAVLYLYASDYISGEEAVARSLCLLIDVHAGKAHEAPRSQQRYLRDVEAACAEIAARWSAF